MDVSYFSYADPAGIPASIKTRETEQRQEMFSELFVEARQALREGFASLVDHMADITTPDRRGKVKRFKTSSLEKWFEFLDAFSARDITDDAQLAKLVKQARDFCEKHHVSYDALKKQANVRTRARAAFEKIKKNATKCARQKPKRHIELGSSSKGGKRKPRGRRIDLD